MRPPSYVKRRNKEVPFVSRNLREYSLNSVDRTFEIERKFGKENIEKVKAQLRAVSNPTDNILGAIIFLSRQNNIEDIEINIKIANENVEQLLESVTVKDERG